MPTIIRLFGWIFFFFPNEGNEPIHIHGSKGECDCKYWLDIENYEIREEYTYNMSPKDKKEARRIIMANFDLIIEHWQKWHGDKSNG